MKNIGIFFVILIIFAISMDFYGGIGRNLNSPGFATGSNIAVVHVTRPSAPDGTHKPPAPSPPGASSIDSVSQAQAPTRIDAMIRNMEADYPMVRHAAITCRGTDCTLSAALGDIADASQAGAFHLLMDSNIDLILARNGLHLKRRPVVMVMGGVYTGFSAELTR